MEKYGLRVLTNVNRSGDNARDVQESGSDVHQHKQALKDLEAKLVVRAFRFLEALLAVASLTKVNGLTRWQIRGRS